MPRKKRSREIELTSSDLLEPSFKTSANIFECIQEDKLPVLPVRENEKINQTTCHIQLPQPPFLLTVVAPRKSGKTNLIVNSLICDDQLCHKFDVILIWSRTFKHDSKWKNIKLPEGSVTGDFLEEEAIRILEVAEVIAEETVVNTLFIFDDMITEGIMNSHRMGTVENIAVRGRHANVSIIIITQMYMALSTSVRNNSTNSIFFRIRNGDELDKIARENRESLSKNDFLEVYNYATQDPYSFLHVNNQQADPSKRFWKCWDTCLHLKTKNKIK